MTATSKNIELIVKQWTTFDLKTIQVKDSWLTPCSFRVELIVEEGKKKNDQIVLCNIYIAFSIITINLYTLLFDIKEAVDLRLDFEI